MTMAWKWLTGVAAAGALTACGPQDQTDDASEAAPPSLAAPMAPAQVEESDSVADLRAPITDIAFWTHPTLPFRSVVATADPRRIALWDMEAELLDERKGAFGGPIDLRYLRAEAGVVRPAVLAAYDADLSAVVFFGVDLQDRVITSRGWSETAAPVEALCLYQDVTDGALYLFTGTDEAGLSQSRLTLRGDEIAAEPVRDIDLAQPARHCVGDDMDGFVYGADAGGALFRAPAAPEAELGAARISASGLLAEPAGVGLLYNSGGALLMAADRNAVLVFALESLALAGAFAIAEAGKIAAFNVSNANFGGVYRDGLIVIGDGTPALRFAPWNGVANGMRYVVSPGPQPRDLGAGPRAEPAANPEGVNIAIPPRPEEPSQ